MVAVTQDAMLRDFVVINVGFFFDMIWATLTFAAPPDMGKRLSISRSLNFSSQFLKQISRKEIAMSRPFIYS
jgi:hypothetical protein